MNERLAGLYTQHTGRKSDVLTPRMEARILNWTRKEPTDGSTHWSTRRLAKKLEVHHMMVARVWKKHGIEPHRIERYKVEVRQSGPPHSNRLKIKCYSPPGLKARATLGQPLHGLNRLGPTGEKCRTLGV